MRKGFTLIELLAVIVILAVIALIATPIILGIINNVKREAFKNSTYGIIDAARKEFVEEMYSSQTAADITFTYTNSEESSSVAGKSLNYTGKKPDNGTVRVTSDGDVAVAIHDGTYCSYKSFIDNEVKVETVPLSECTEEYSSSKGVNVPVLASGMIPIKWDGSKWIETTISDSNWYDYVNKEWANVKTADGSMWVWIPRYIYRITSGWHSNLTGGIEIQFSKSIVDDWNDSITLNTNSTSGASNNTWTNHPAFTFGGVELNGIWVAKFEPTAAEGIASSSSSCDDLDNTATKTIKIIPNATSWRCMVMSNSFTASRNMEINAIYGWGTSGTGIDTHMMKNTEFGMISYLSKSVYGQNTNEVWINPSDNYTTGCAGDSVSSGLTTGCLRTYNTTNGQKASTTGNVYGIYDMSGGAYERVAAYVANGNSILTTTANNVLVATAQYKDVYTVGSPDSEANNYALTNNKKGDAAYEISSNVHGSFSWFNDFTHMGETSTPIVIRGGDNSKADGAGMFSISDASGWDTLNYSFRPILLVNSGL